MTFMRSDTSVERTSSGETVKSTSSTWNPLEKTTGVFDEHLASVANRVVSLVDPFPRRDQRARFQSDAERERDSRAELVRKHKELNDRVAPLREPSPPKFKSGGWVSWASGSDRRNELKANLAEARARRQAVDNYGSSLRDTQEKYQMESKFVHQREDCARSTLQHDKDSSCSQQ